MNEAIKWWPVFVAGSVTAALVALLVTSDGRPSSVPSLPVPLHTVQPRASEASTTAQRLLFTQPIPEAAQDKPSEVARPLPVLVGIASARGRAVALLKIADGQTARARVGDRVDGWTVDSISGKKVFIGDRQRQEELILLSGDKNLKL